MPRVFFNRLFVNTFLASRPVILNLLVLAYPKLKNWTPLGTTPPPPTACLPLPLVENCLSRTKLSWDLDETIEANRNLSNQTVTYYFFWVMEYIHGLIKTYQESQLYGIVSTSFQVSISVLTMLRPPPPLPKWYKKKF